MGLTRPLVLRILKGMHVRLLFLLLALSGTISPVLAAIELDSLEACPVFLVQPVLDADGELLTRSDGDTIRYVFREAVPGSDAKTDQVRTYIQTNPAVTIARKLYSFACARNATPQKAVMVLCVTDLFGSVGPMHAPYAVEVENADGSKVLAGSFLILSDLDAQVPGTTGPTLTVDVLMTNDLLGLTLAHESAHQVMCDRYGLKDSPAKASLSKSGHDTNQISDPNLAFSEGWAEAFEAAVSDILQAQHSSPAIGHPSLRKLETSRHELIERNRYIFEDAVSKSGRLRAGLQLISTEGVAANLVYLSYNSRLARQYGPREAYGRVLDTLARGKPKDVVTFWKNRMTDSAPALRDKLHRMFVEETKYVTVDADAPARYLGYWLPRHAFLKATPSDPRRPQLRKESEEAEAAYRKWKAAAYQVVAASGSLDTALPPNLDPLWVDFGYDGRVGLNLATVDQLADLFRVAYGDSGGHLALAQRIIDARDSSTCGGYFTDVAGFTKHLEPGQHAQIEQLRRDFLSHVAATRHPTIIRADLARFSRQHTFARRLLRAVAPAYH